MTSLPGFTAGLSAYPAGGHYVVAGKSGTLTPDGRVVVPQQECFTRDGKCTGVWPWYQGEQCITGTSGAQQCCVAAGTWPQIRECQNPDGSWRVARMHCPGPCVW
jgi:hypothetical protein